MTTPKRMNRHSFRTAKIRFQSKKFLSFSILCLFLTGPLIAGTGLVKASTSPSKCALVMAKTGRAVSIKKALQLGPTQLPELAKDLRKDLIEFLAKNPKYFRQQFILKAMLMMDFNPMGKDTKWKTTKEFSSLVNKFAAEKNIFLYSKEMLHAFEQFQLNRVDYSMKNSWNIPRENYEAIARVKVLLLQEFGEATFSWIKGLQELGSPGSRLFKLPRLFFRGETIEENKLYEWEWKSYLKKIESLNRNAYKSSRRSVKFNDFLNNHYDRQSYLSYFLTREKVDQILDNLVVLHKKPSVLESFTAMILELKTFYEDSVFQSKDTVDFFNISNNKMPPRFDSSIESSSIFNFSVPIAFYRRDPHFGPDSVKTRIDPFNRSWGPAAVYENLYQSLAYARQKLGQESLDIGTKENIERILTNLKLLSEHISSGLSSSELLSRSLESLGKKMTINIGSEPVFRIVLPLHKSNPGRNFLGELKNEQLGNLLFLLQNPAKYIDMQLSNQPKIINSQQAFSHLLQFVEGVHVFTLLTKLGLDTKLDKAMLKDFYSNKLVLLDFDSIVQKYLSPKEIEANQIALNFVREKYESSVEVLNKKRRSLQ